MKFYGSGIVWDKQNNKRLCKFVNGEFETDDPRTIKILKFLYYKDDDRGRKAEQADTKRQEVEKEQAETIEGIELEEMTYNELKSLAKAEGLTVGHKSKVDLIKALKEGV